MKMTFSYGVEIFGIEPKYLNDTRRIFNDAIAFLMVVVNKEWAVVSNCKDAHERLLKMEQLTHSTKDRKITRQLYNFDKAFPKFPSYLRRAAIYKAIGNISSYKSNYQNWVDSGKKGNAPTLQYNHADMPTFYNKNMYIREGDFRASIKVYKNHDWVFVPIRLKKTDVKYLDKYWNGVKASAPTLEKRYKKWFLRFAYEESGIQLSDKPIREQVICAVDLGINTDATCSILTFNGTVLGRKFISFPSEKDQIYRDLNRIKGIQQMYCSANARSLWRYTTHLNDELSKKVANAIVSYAVENNCDCIVFEHLDIKGKKYGKKKQKLAMWKKNTIQDLATAHAHRHGIRVSHVCAWNTSKLAFDGSGKVKRDECNYSLCVFQTGKQYNCDLSASYNIGARYFIRKAMESLDQNLKSRITAKVPESGRRTIATLNTLKQLNLAIAELEA